jgi:hypothetical protein
MKTQLVLLLTIVQCCTIFGSDTTNRLLRVHRNAAPPQPSLLPFIALKRAVEKMGFDMISKWIKNCDCDGFRREVTTNIDIPQVVPYAFMWCEQINRSDTSPTAQFLFHELSEKGDWHGATKIIRAEKTYFDSNGLLQSFAHDHRKNDILAMLEELKPMNTKTINSILTNNNIGHL